MDNGSDNVLLIIFALIAAFVLLQLRRTLGKKTGYDPKDDQNLSRTSHEDHDNQAQNAQANQEDASIVPLNNQTPETLKRLQLKKIGFAEKSPLHAPFKRICELDQNFSYRQFIDGAEAAYGMILQAFWSFDKEALSGLLSREVYEQFVQSIDQRQALNHVLDNVIEDIEMIEVIDASLEGTVAEVKVKYVSHMRLCVRDQEGNLLEGNPDQVIKIVDIWTYNRDVSRRDPVWTLVLTEAAS